MNFFRGIIGCGVLVLTTVGTFAQGLVVPTNLPIMVIDTHGQQIQDDPKIPADMAIIYNGPGKLNHAADTVFDFKGKIGIELRGSSSQGFDKKPFAVEIQDGAGNSIDAPLLGMPKKDDWVLDASYDDKTLLRNELAYRLGRAMGRYASRTRYVEVIMNGADIGVYGLQEKVKRDKNRVNIAKLDPTSVSGDDVTGGYIIKIDKTTGSGGDGWYSPHLPVGNGSPIYFQYDYPKPEDLVVEQKEYIKNYVGQFEDALSGTNFANPVTGYANYIDVPSLVDFFLMMEVTKNPDGYRLSTYLSKKKDSDGGKLSMGPIWDFNEGFGNVNYCTQGNPEGFVWHFNSICPDDTYQIPFWWARLFEDPTFQQSVYQRWISLRQGAFKTENALSYIDSVSTALRANNAMQRNFQVWQVMGVYVWPNYYVGASYDDEITWIENWVSDRMTWLDQNIADVVASTRDVPSAFSVSTFPNPFVQDITVELTINQPGDSELTLFDALGRKLETRTQSYDAPGKYRSTFHLSFPGGGIYYFKAKMGGTVVVTRVIKT